MLFYKEGLSICSLQYVLFISESLCNEKHMKRDTLSYLVILLLLIASTKAVAETRDSIYWNTRTQLFPFRLPPAPIGHQPRYIDLNGDGKPDVLQTVTASGIPVQWIDDDGSMRYGDLEGSTKNGCLMIDVNRDGIYGGYGDLIVDWIAADEDGNPAMMVIVENCKEDEKMKSRGHYMWMIDTDGDNVMGCIDWATFQLRNWLHSGRSNFFTDYHGQAAFLKIHESPEKINDLRLNWETPFLFYDPDHDGLTEVAIRLLDTPEHEVVGDQRNVNLKGRIDWVSISWDMDNDNSPGNEFDLDMTLHFKGPGFDYTDQRHTNKNMRGLPEADSLFMNPRWRQLTELRYPDHQTAWDLIFHRGEWNETWFTYDEDDDCNRWERVEMYHPLNPFKVGPWKGGVDNNAQSDPAGDRGEWDRDNSGKGQLYVGRFDGRIHLYGAENGIWRIDQFSQFYQGMGLLYDGYGPERIRKEPESFATVRYTDTDGNGFLDQIEYDLDGDTVFETKISLHELGLDDTCELIHTADLSYDDFCRLQKQVSNDMWTHAQTVLEVAGEYAIGTSWYALMMHPRSDRERYHYGYWLAFYLYKDIEYALLSQHAPEEKLRTLHQAYYSRDWSRFKTKEDTISSQVKSSIKQKRN
jgi:hypothetical protein